MSTMSTKVYNFAFYSRILVFLMQILFNLVIPDHDAKVFNPPSAPGKLPLDHVAEILVGGLRRWDGIYFQHIAEHGYTYENSLAFFPLFPLCVRVVANTLLCPLQLVVSYTHTLTLAACTLNFLVFIKSATLLYNLTLHILGDEKLAFKAAQLYCINPASIFFSACYSETLFTFFTFKGLLHLEQGGSWAGSVLFGLSASTRSNGLVNAGFVVYRNFLQAVRTIQNLNSSAGLSEKKTTFIAVSRSLFFLLGSLFLQMVLCVLPFIVFQCYAYTVFCNRNASYRDLQSHIVSYGIQQGYKMPHTGLSPWCRDTVPNSYSYLQANHWHLGFMSYWTARQIPNFLLATPIVLLSTAAIVSYVWNNVRICVSLGVCNAKHSTSYKKTDEDVVHNVGFHQPAVFVYVAELCFLVLFGLFFMHVQVLTRFICSSSPVIYWFIAHITTPQDKLNPKKCNRPDIFTNLIKQIPNTGLHTQGQQDSEESSVQLSQQAVGQQTDRSVDGDSYEKKKHSVKAVDHSSTSELEDLYDWDSKNWLHRAIFIYMHLYFFVGIAAFSNFLPWT